MCLGPSSGVLWVLHSHRHGADMVAAALFQGVSLCLPGNMPPAVQSMRNMSPVLQVTKKAADRSEDARAHTQCPTPPVPLPAAAGGCAAINRETSPRPRCSARAEPPSAAPGLRLLGESSSQEIPSFQPQRSPRSGTDPPLTPALTRQLRLPSRRVCGRRGRRHS